MLLLEIMWLGIIRTLFTSEFSGIDEELSELIQPLISTDENERLCALSSDEEIKVAMDQIGALKALSPNGMSAIFYQHYWETVQEKLRAMVIQLFRTVYLLQ